MSGKLTQLLVLPRRCASPVEDMPGELQLPLPGHAVASSGAPLQALISNTLHTENIKTQVITLITQKKEMNSRLNC